MPKYSTQLVVQANADNTIANGSTRIAAKAVNSGQGPVPIVAFPDRANGNYTPSRLNALRRELARLDANSRVYVRGHGSPSKQTVGGVGWQEWADTLVACGLPSVALITICGCRAGRDAGVSFGLNANLAQKNASDQLQSSMNDDFEIPGPLGQMIGVQADSFASRFHARLGEQGVRTTVFARTYLLQTNPDGSKTTRIQKGGARVHHRARSKLGYSWRGNVQVRNWVLYGEDATLAAVAQLLG